MVDYDNLPEKAKQAIAKEKIVLHNKGLTDEEINRAIQPTISYICMYVENCLEDGLTREDINQRFK